MRKIILTQGTVAGINIERNDATATSVSFFMKNDESGAIISKNANYIGEIAIVEFDGADTAIPGVYSFQVNENLSGGGIAKYGAEDCDGDGNCEYGVVIICEALDGGIS